MTTSSLMDREWLERNLRLCLIAALEEGLLVPPRHWAGYSMPHKVVATQVAAKWADHLLRNAAQMAEGGVNTP